MIRASNNPTECTPVRLAQSLGEFASLAALQAAHPTAAAGSYAVVNVADGDDLVYYFSVSDNAWFTYSGSTTTDLQTRLLSVGAITVAGNTVSVASASALILGVEVINAEGISFMVPFAVEGKIRIDLVVLNSDGDLLRISGTETDSGNIAVPPINLVPTSAVIVTQINVTDADLVTIIPTYLSLDEEQAIHNSANPNSSNPFATVNDTTLFKVLSQGDRPIRMSDGDGDTILELDDRGKLVSNLDGDFLHLPSEFYPVGSVLKIYNPSSADLFLLPTDDVPYISINQFSIFVDEFSPVTLNPGIASLKKTKSFDVDSYEEWILTYELFDFSKEALELENVDNTHDMEKPVSVFQADAISAAQSNAVIQASAQTSAQINALYQTAPAKVAADVNITPLSGAKTIQGVIVGQSDVVLLMNQSDPKENGLWVIAGSSGNPWVRPTYYTTDTFINRKVLKVYDGDYSGREFKSIGSVGSNITITEVTDSKLKSSTGSDTKSTMTQKAISDELALKANKSTTRQIVRSKNNGTFGSHTGNTAETVLFTIPITGGEFEIGDWMDFMFQFERLVTGTNINVRLRVGTNGNTSDAQIALLTMVSATLDSAIKRERFEFTTGNILKGMNSSSSATVTDIANITASRTSTSLNPTNNWYLTISATLGSGSDTILCTGYQIGKTKTF